MPASNQPVESESGIGAHCALCPGSSSASPAGPSAAATDRLLRLERGDDKTCPNVYDYPAMQVAFQ
jgi:hypothetical protein